MNQIGKKVVAFMLALTMIGSFPTLTAYATETEPVTTEEQEVETSNVDADNDSGLREISTPETADSGLNDDNDFQNLDADTFSEEAVEENSVSMMTAEDSEP